MASDRKGRDDYNANGRIAGIIGPQGFWKFANVRNANFDAGIVGSRDLPARPAEAKSFALVVTQIVRHMPAECTEQEVSEALLSGIDAEHDRKGEGIESVRSSDWFQRMLHAGMENPGSMLESLNTLIHLFS
jgi:hypothetical protein